MKHYISKIQLFSTIKTDLIINVRTYGFIPIIISLVMFILIYLADRGFNVTTHYLSVVLIFLIYSSMIINMFSRTKHDVVRFSTFPFILTNLVFARNLSTIIILSTSAFIINSIVVVFSAVTNRKIINILFYYLVLMFLMLISGNIISIKKCILKNNGKSTVWLKYITIHVVLFLSGIIYLLIHKLTILQQFYVVIITIVLYTLHILLFSKIIKKHKYNMLG